MADFRDGVRKKLADMIEKKPDNKQYVEDVVRVLFFLDVHDEECRKEEDAAVSPFWKSLKALLNSDTAFEMFAMRLANDTKTAEADPKFRKVMRDLYEGKMTESGEGGELNAVPPGYIEKSGFIELSLIWTMLPQGSRASIVSLIPVMAGGPVALITSGSILAIPAVVGAVATVALASVFLCFEALHSIYRWWKGEISGTRCTKNVMDATFTISAGVGGGMLGAAVGAFAGPVGIVAGAVIGGVISSQVASYLSDKLTQWLFGLPKSEALENAYNFLGVKYDATNSDINTAYRKLCLKHHPDKGGKEEDFLLLQNSMAVIKAARGDI